MSHFFTFSAALPACLLATAVTVGTSPTATAQTPSPFSTVSSTYSIPILSTTFATPGTSSTNGTLTNEPSALAGWNIVRTASVANTFDTSVQTGFNFVSGGRFGPLASSQAAGLQLFNLPANIIPVSPGGSSVGVVLTAHDLTAAIPGPPLVPADVGTTTATQSIALVRNSPLTLPVGSDSYAVRFNAWLNFTPGGAGSSEFGFWGVNGPTIGAGGQTIIGATSAGVSGLTAALPTAGVGPITAGTTFSSTVDGGFARDLRVYNGSVEEIADTNFIVKNIPGTTGNVFDNVAQDALLNAASFTNNTAPAVTGIPGNQWLDITVFSSPTETTYYINGNPIYSRSGFTPIGNLFLGYFDLNTSISPLASQTFAIYTDYQVLVAIPEPTTLAVLAGSFALMLRRKSR